MKNIKRILLLVTLSLSTLLFSCTTVEVDTVKHESEVETQETSETKEVEKVVLGEELTSLDEEVNTLSHYKLPKINEELYGFKVNAIYDYKDRNAKVVLFEHMKTGAKAFLISNDDEDKTAAFGFNTLTFDDKGVPHVFEHASLGGSEKYPNSNLFDEVVNRTYNTFMNAMTMQHATVYPFSSLSDTQLFALYKFYLDGVLNPNIIRDEKNLEKEAYRYTLYDAKGDINLNGIVYSEMAGNEGNISDVAYRNSLKTMYKDSFMGVNTGGATSEIPKITHEDLIEFHEKYYHPSNMVIMLYGDIDYKKYLKYSDEEYLSKYDKKTIDKSDDNYKKQDGFHMEKFDFPVASDSEVDGKSIINYNMTCEGMTPYESGLFELVLSALENSDGPIYTRLKKKLPEAALEIDNGLFYPKPYFSLVFYNVNSDDVNTIREIVEEAFSELIEKGVSEDVLEDVMNYIEIGIENEKDSHGFANESAIFFARTFSTNGDNLLGFLQHDKAMKEIEGNYKNGKIKELMDKYLEVSKNSSMGITSPKKGLLEGNSLKRKEELRKMKDGLIDDEIKELINKTKEYDKWIDEESKSSMIDVLRVATISELDEYKAKCYAYEEKIEGINFIRSEIEDLKYNYFNILFDISNLSIEEAMKLKFISSALSELPSKNYPGQKLSAALNRYATFNYAGINVNEYYNGGYKPYFAFSFMSLDRNLNKVFELLNELMNEIIFEDTSIIKNFASSELKLYKNHASESPRGLADEIINVKTNNDSLYDYSISGINYINFLKQVVAMNDTELKELLKTSEELYKNVYNRNGMVCQIIGNFDTTKEIKNKVIDMAYGFKNEKVVNNINLATKSELKNNIAIVINGTVQYNYIAMPLKLNNIDYSAKYAVMGNILNDEFLYQEFRVKRSVYGSFATSDRFKTYVFTYRDPNLRESYEEFKEIPKFINGVNLDEDELDDYKLNAYANFAYPLTKMQAAEIAINEVFTKTDDRRPDRYLRYMREIKNMKSEDIKELAKLYDKLVSEGMHVTVGGREAIEMNADLFDEIIYDYIK